jgi:hypothetical protein
VRQYPHHQEGRQKFVIGLTKLSQLGIATGLALTLHLPDGTALKPYISLVDLGSAGTDGEYPLIVKQKGVSID